MDYNDLPLGLGLAFASNRTAMERFVGMTDHEKEEFLKEWPKKEKDFYSRIIPRFTYNGPIKERII